MPQQKKNPVYSNGIYDFDGKQITPKMMSLRTIRLCDSAKEYGGLDRVVVIFFGSIIRTPSVINISNTVGKRGRSIRIELLSHYHFFFVFFPLQA